MPYASPKMIQRARQLRQPLTPAEAMLWRALRSRQANGLKFRRQHPIGPYVADFYCAQAQLVIEIDGPSHLGQEEYDQARTAWLESQGYRVVRYANSEVQENTAAVLENIVERCQHPPYPPADEPSCRCSSRATSTRPRRTISPMEIRK